jgi:dTDP-4-dehydrorhamnose reductase
VTTQTILVTGATGLLAPYIVDAAADHGNVVTTSRSGGTHPCDLTDERAVVTLLTDTQPDIVIHTAAATNVDLCERDSRATYEINQHACRYLCRAVSKNTKLVMISTDQVYPDQSGPHEEGMEEPVNIYGKSKFAGEMEIAKHANSAILRTNIFGPSRTLGRASLSDFFVRAFTTGEAVTLYEDALFSPLHMQTLAEVVARVFNSELRGVYNAGSRDGMSKAEFGRYIAKHLGLSTEAASSGQSGTAPGRATRATDLRMNSTRLEQALGFRFPLLRQEIDRL